MLHVLIKKSFFAYYFYALNKIHEQMSLEDVESLLEETNEVMKQFRQANSYLYVLIFIMKTYCIHLR
jgi:hypothetical protein